MRILLTGLALAVMIAMAGVAAAADNRYTSSMAAVDATGWDTDGSVVVGPDASTAADIYVTVNKGRGANEDEYLYINGGLVVDASNSDSGDDYDTTLTFTSQTDEDTLIFFRGTTDSGTYGVSLQGTDEYGATLIVESDTSNTFVVSQSGTYLGTNATLTVNGTNAMYASLGDMVIDDVRTDDSFSTGGLLVGGGTVAVYSGVETEDSVLRLNKGIVLVSGNGVVVVDNFIMGDDDAGTTEDDGVTVTAGSMFMVQKYTPPNSDGNEPREAWETSEALIRKGHFLAEKDSTVAFHGGVTLSDGAVMELRTIDFLLGDETALTIGGENGSAATLNIGDGSAMHVAIMGFDAEVINASGILNVNEKADFSVTALVSAAATTIHESAVVRTDSFKVTGGATSVKGEIASATAGEGLFRIEGGRVDILPGAVISTDSMVVAGGEVAIRGTLAEGVAFSATSGITNITTGAVIGAGNGLASFSVGGLGDKGGVVNLQENVVLELPVDTGFTLSGGTINLGENSSLKVLGNAQNIAGGTLVFAGDHSSAEFNNSLVFTGGGLVAKGINTTLNMNGNTLSITRGAVLDTSAAALVIDNTLGLTLSGTYRPGANNYRIVMASLQTGGIGFLNVEDNDDLHIDLTGIEEAIHSGLASGDVLILATDIIDAGASELITWAGELGEDTYYFETRLDPTTGTIGLYVTGFAELSEAERHRRILGNWNTHPRVRGNAEKLINTTLNRAVSQARRLQTTAYSSLSRDGKFNADVLTSLSRPSDKTDYDALMLYNGSGLAMVNQAILNSTGQTIKRLAMRNTYVRHELHEAGATFGAGSARASEYLNECLDRRLWVSGNYTSDSMAWDEGFAGYTYRAKGLMLGYDRMCGDFTVGAAFSYLGGDFDDASAMESNSTIDTYGIHAYAGYSHPSGFFLTAATGYAYSDNQIRDLRMLNGNVGWNRADFHSDTYLIAAGMGYDWRPLEYLVVTPSIGISYQNSKNEGHEQFFSSNDGAAAAGTLQPGRIKNHSTTMPLDLAFRYDLLGDEDRLMSITGNIGYAYEFNNTGADGDIGYMGLGGVDPVAIASRHPGRHVLNVGVGAKYIFRQYEVSLNYDYVGRVKYNSHAVTGTVSMSF